MAELYDTTRFGQLYYASRQPTSNHLFLAANHLARICQNANIPHAFLGGWTVRLRGGSRETQDVDITVATTMELFKKTLLQMPRYVLVFNFGQNKLSYRHSTSSAWRLTLVYEDDLLACAFWRSNEKLSL
jgi:hypothetical protein